MRYSTSTLGGAAALLFSVLVSVAAPSAGEMGIKQAAQQCNGERDETPDEIIAGCTRVIQYGGEAFGGVKYAYMNRGYAYRDKGQCDRALADFNKAISMRANKPRVFRARGSVLLCLRRYDEALADLNHAIEKDPSDAWAYYYRGRVHLAKGDRAQAQADFGAAVKLDPDMEPRVTEALAALPPK